MTRGSRNRSTRVVLAALLALATTAAAETWTGFNVKRAANAPWHSPAAAQSMLDMRHAGANAVAIVVFLWQPEPAAGSIVRGGDTGDAELAAAIRLARGLGLKVLVKPHVWVPNHWAGDVRPRDDAIGRWFEAYERELERIARIAQEERADALAVGTELKQLAQRTEWDRVIRTARRSFRGTLVYVASSIEEAEAFDHWSRLDAIAASLYPSARSIDAWVDALERAGARLAALGKRYRLPVWAAEVGVRSLEGALEAPWASPERRAGKVDLELQTRALPAARAAFRRAAAIDAFLVWCWYTDSQAGGPNDTDFTPQNKPARDVLRTN